MSTRPALRTIHDVFSSHHIFHTLKVFRSLHLQEPVQQVVFLMHPDHTHLSTFCQCILACFFMHIPTQFIHNLVYYAQFCIAHALFCTFLELLCFRQLYCRPFPFARTNEIPLDCWFIFSYNLVYTHDSDIAFSANRSI